MTLLTDPLRLATDAATAAEITPTVRLLASDGTVTGTAAPGSLVTVFANGRQQGQAITPDANGAFSTHLTVPLSLGASRVNLVAVATGAGGTNSATPTEYAYVLPTPVISIRVVEPA